MRSIQSTAVAYNDALVIVEPPSGYLLKTPLEQDLWEMYSKMRLSRDWNSSDLVDLYWIVRIEADLMDIDESVRETGMFELDQRSGTLRPSTPLAARQALLRDVWKAKARLGLTLDANYQQHLLKRSSDNVVGHQEKKPNAHMRLLAGNE